MNKLLLCMGLTTALLACSESKTDDGAGGEGGSSSSDGGAGGDGGSSSSNGGSAGDGGSTSSSGGGAPAGSVVINEIEAGEDWIELFNGGASAFDLSGLVLADADGPGVPKLAEAISFPAGTSIAPGGYLFVLAKQDAVVMPGEQVPQTMCAPGPSPCFFAPFGLSGTDGDEIFLLDGDTTVASATYPAMAVPDGSSWCRLPNGTGAFAECAPTPGAANAAP